MNDVLTRRGKRIALGILFSAGSFYVVQTVMGRLYSLLGRPFDGSLVVGAIYNLVQGTLGVALCQTLLVLTADRQLAGTATRYATGLYLFIFVGGFIWASAAGQLSAGWPTVIVSTSTLAAPWILAAVFARRRLIIEWRGRSSAS